jgi:hypothetical protein
MQTVVVQKYIEHTLLRVLERGQGGSAGWQGQPRGEDAWATADAAVAAQM